MSTQIPKTAAAWTVGQNTGDNTWDGLVLNPETAVEEPSDYEVLVKLHAASLNYRDLIIPKGLYPFALKDKVVPGSDGAGEVIAVGAKVTRFKVGDKVVTLFNQTHLGGSLDGKSVKSGLGGAVPGTLRQYGTFNENGLVEMPSSLSYLEASTLSCAAVTAWNALYGLKPLAPGDVVLTQGTGGVSIFGLQFAKAAGATVIATTSSAAKAETLKALGADHVINYKETPNWGEVAKALTPNGEGCHHVLEVAGPVTMAQSLKAIRIDGVISIIGFVAGPSTENQPTYLDTLTNLCTVRGFLVGSRLLFEDMNRAIEATKIKPVVDEKVFSLGELREAYQYMWEQKHFGKLTIKID